MAVQSSSSLSSPCFPLQQPVFFSFARENAENYFIFRLTNVMRTKGVNVTIDEEELNDEESIEDRLCGIIGKSAICLPILSKSYAKSRRRLLELNQMVESKKFIVPVFYDVDPSEVRALKGAFDEATILAHQLGERVSINLRKALRTVTEIPGFDLKNGFDDDRTKLIEMLTTLVTNTLSYTVKDMPMHLVGFESRVEAVMELLDIEVNDVRVIGIHGIEGTGKTVLAKSIFYKLFDRYEAACFIPDIKEKSKTPEGLVDLRNHLVSQILIRKGIRNSDKFQDIKIMKEHFPKMRIIVVLDDVDRENQLLALAGSKDWFGEGSRIIVTTRDENILKLHQNQMTGFYQMKVLTDDESLQLFSWYAFGTPGPPTKYSELSERIVCASGGVPLILKMFGSSLSSTTVDGKPNS